ncbi:hypothetical protein WH390_06160 [Candidatus Arsenophonus nilaparvatae]|uniref:hypothetical protein n=1 Tax=Candidatus Arsenophonus nilaparvatae TaxID=1247023 RepID=UPI0038780872
MKRAWIGVLLTVSPLLMAKGVMMELDNVPLPQALNVLYRQVFERPFMLSPELINDPRKVTFRITPEIDERAFIKRYLNNLQIAIHERNGIDYLVFFTPKTPTVIRKPMFISPVIAQYRIYRIYYAASLMVILIRLVVVFQWGKSHQKKPWRGRLRIF